MEQIYYFLDRFMSDWPPKPQNESHQISSQAQQPTGNEWKLLEKAVLASVENNVVHVVGEFSLSF